MAEPWVLLLLALGCPALPTDPTAFLSSPEGTSLLRPAQQGVGSTPFPSLAPPITLLVDGKQQMLVVCLVLDVAPPGFESPIWFSAGNGSSLDAFTYGPSPAEDGTWTRLAQLSLHSEELAAWDTLVCHTGPGAGDHSQSTQPLQLSGDTSSSRTCLWEPLGGQKEVDPLTTASFLDTRLRTAGTQALVLRLGALRLLLFKLLLLDVLLTCSRLRAPPTARGDPAGASRPGATGLATPPEVPRADSRLLPQPLPPRGSSAGPADQIRRNNGGTTGRGLSVSASPALEPRDRRRQVHNRRPARDPRNPIWEEGPLVLRAWSSRSSFGLPTSSLGAFPCNLPPPADQSFPGG